MLLRYWYFFFLEFRCIVNFLFVFRHEILSLCDYEIFMTEGVEHSRTMLFVVRFIRFDRIKACLIFEKIFRESS